MRFASKTGCRVARVAESAHLNPTSLYRTLSLSGNLGLASLLAIFSAVGLKIQVQAVDAIDYACSSDYRIMTKTKQNCINASRLCRYVLTENHSGRKRSGNSTHRTGEAAKAESMAD